MDKIVAQFRKELNRNVKIEYNGKTIEFDLYDELRINSADVTHNIVTHPRLYGFLGLIQARLQREVEMASSEMKRTQGSEFVKFKNQNSKATGRANSDDVAKALAENSKVYRQSISKYIKVKEQFQIINHCMEAFKQRKELIQTLSSNTRKNS